MSEIKNNLLRFLRQYFRIFLVLLGIVVSGTFIIINKRSDFTDISAKNLTSLIAKRMNILDGYMHKAAAESDWPELENFPEDMVIYRYVGDSLKAWCNQFTLDNDDISKRMYIQRFINLRFNVVSPLASVDTNVNYINIGPKWYLVKALYADNAITIIGGLEIKNTLSRSSHNGVNRHLKVSDRFSLYPISYSGGAPVYVGGKPLIKIIQENTGVAPLLPEPIYIWIALFVLIASVLIYLYRHRTIRVLWVSLSLLTVFVVVVFIVGKGFQTVSEIFSPTVYAQGPFLYSLASLILINLWIFLMVSCIYMNRRPIIRFILSRPDSSRLRIWTISVAIFVVSLPIYIHLTFTGLIMNSNINLELYKVSGINRYTIYIYLSYISLFMALAMLSLMLKPAMRKKNREKYSISSRSFRIFFAVISAVYLLTMSSVLGFRKEENRIDIWANRLAVDRNLGFELRLRRLEMGIAVDPVIPALIPINKDYRVVMNRINETYLNRISQEYETSLYMFNDSDPMTDAFKFFNERIQNSVAIADSSRFFYSRSTNGRARYTGMFTYYNPKIGVTRLFIGIDSKLDKEGTGYSAIIGDSGAGSVVIPQRYSYAKYLSGNLISYRGSYPYPTKFSGRLKQISDDFGEGYASIDKYLHFVMRISDEESIVISREKVDFIRYMVAGFLIALLAFFCISLPALRTTRKDVFEKNYYKTRINTVLYFSLFATLITMTAISVVFIYRRNETNIMNLMTGKITTIQSFIEARSRYFTSDNDFNNSDFNGVLENIGSYTKSDISLYSPEGKVIKSTANEVFEKMMLGSRVDEDAYKNIMFRNKRYYIHKEKFAGHTYYAMYAPVINSEGRKLAIICAPYTDSGLEFKFEAVFHAIFIITAFLLLIFFSRILSSKVIDKMFKPLMEMAKKMNRARIDELEYIIYDREDEITGLVHSYNLMVHDLSESTKQLAVAERSRTLNSMSRQVAHEIKNLMTPFKLQIQRLIRLRENNNPLWEEKFDHIVPIIMDSINSLSETALDYNALAQVDVEERVLLDLDELASNQVSLVDCKDNITIQYMGLKKAMVIGPKTQLIRVLVNLITNSLQALETMWKDEMDNRSRLKQGLVYISIRNSIKDGFYDVVVEDNGPGVKDSDRHNLFVPNFTTKSSGTGLGLAICKSVAESCGGDIQYSRSFTLQGACFTLRIPKAKM